MFDDPAHFGYLGITLFLILTGCGLPIPEEAAIIAAGVAAGVGKLDPWLALAACIVGAVAGDSAMYGIGRFFGSSLLQKHPVFNRVLTAEREQHIEGLLKQHGWKMILLTRFLVGLRSPVYLTAGILKYPYPRFLFTDTLCGLSVITVFFGLTYFYGAGVMKWIHNVEGLITVAVVALVVVGLMVYWMHRRSRAMLGDDDTEKSETDAPAVNAK